MSEDAPVLTKKQRAAALLKESTKSVIKEAFYMKRAMDQEDVRLALKHASQMLGELRTSLLSPMNYYELYMKVCDELMYLEMFFREQTEKRKAGRCGVVPARAKLRQRPTKAIPPLLCRRDLHQVQEECLQGHSERHGRDG